MVVVMVMAFLLCWLPYAAFALSVILDPSLHINPLIATVPMYLAKSSTVYNPIIYVFMNRQRLTCPGAEGVTNVGDDVSVDQVGVCLEGPGVAEALLVLGRRSQGS
eukprot:XP_013990128.1 PREDICTED: parapinopsin-like [Salmo salar]